MRRIALLLAIILLYSCAPIESTMKLSSSAFGDGKGIPPAHTCDGADSIPPLDIAEVPTIAKSLALVMDDPDAPRGVWDHWIVWNIPTTTKKITGQPEGVPGTNSKGELTYHGPCPPSGTHRYFFKLYAIDSMLDLTAGSSKAELIRAMQGHIVGEAQLMGTYQRKKN